MVSLPSHSTLQKLNYEVEMRPLNNLRIIPYWLRSRWYDAAWLWPRPDLSPDSGSALRLVKETAHVIKPCFGIPAMWNVCIIVSGSYRSEINSLDNILTILPVTLTILPVTLTIWRVQGKNVLRPFLSIFRFRCHLVPKCVQHKQN
jgi:hypothetical protein